MNKPKISVIIPVYNTEKYVKEALLSITNQTLKEIEIIVINDGSNDNSLEVITKVGKTDNRILIYNQENQGQSVARNMGISKAKGEYIYFMDSDDLLDTEALEYCYKKCIQENLDFIFFDAEIIYDSKDISFPLDYHRPEIEEKVYNGAELLNELIERNLYRSAIWMSFIRLTYLQEINLNFHPGIIHEDELFSAILYIEAKRVGRIGRNFFKRRIRRESTMTKQFSWKNIEGYFTVVEELKKYLETKPQYNRAILDEYLKKMFNIVIQKAYIFSIKDKIKIILYCIKKNDTILLQPKTIFIFLFKRYIIKWK